MFADSDSDSDNEAPIPASISVPHSSASSIVSPPPKIGKGNKAVTPSPQVPSTSLKKMQDRWLKEAQAIDRKAKIITKVPEAIKAIHTHLHNEGRPMNITSLFESLKKVRWTREIENYDSTHLLNNLHRSSLRSSQVIPNAVLRKSIDKMVSNGETYRGHGSPDDCLRIREGKNSTSTLYFAFEEDPRDYQAQNDTKAEIEVTKCELKKVRGDGGGCRDNFTCLKADRLCHLRSGTKPRGPRTRQGASRASPRTPPSTTPSQPCPTQFPS